MECKQEMPPPGGYAPITYKKVPLKPGLNIHLKLLMAIGVSGLGLLQYQYVRRQRNNEAIEMRCTRLALTPMLEAERDRMILKQLKKNRDAEEEIMKDVEGWEVGKWKGFKVYESIGNNEYIKPENYEFYAHTDENYSDITNKVFYYT